MVRQYRYRNDLLSLLRFLEDHVDLGEEEDPFSLDFSAAAALVGSASSQPLILAYPRHLPALSTHALARALFGHSRPCESSLSQAHPCLLFCDGCEDVWTIEDCEFMFCVHGWHEDLRECS